MDDTFPKTRSETSGRLPDVISYQAWDEQAMGEVILSRLLAQSVAALDDFVAFGSAREPGRMDRLTERLEARWDEIGAFVSEGDTGKQPGKGESPGGPSSAARIALGWFLRRLLPVAAEAWAREEPIPIRRTRLALAYYLPRYVMARALADELGEALGIRRMKEFLDSQIAKRPRPSSPPGTLRELRDRDIPWNLADGGQNAISALWSEHRLLKKVSACRIAEVLRPYGDPELMETIACYPDFASIRRTNEHFMLTRTRTLIRDGDYCDTCFHDCRGEAGVAHPSREVFDRLDGLATQLVGSAPRRRDRRGEPRD